MENIKLMLFELEKKFKIKDLGDVSHLLSMEIKYVPGQSLSISQRGYIGRVLERFKMADCKAMPTPQAKGNFPLPGDPDREAVCVNIDPDVDYQCIVGSLQYLVSCSRPDIASAVRTLGKFLTCYKSKKQPIMTDDTCSAEFVAASECSNMIMCTHHLCEELKLQRTTQTILYEDNQAAIKVIGEVSSGYKVRSVDLKFHKIRDFVERKVFRVEYCPSEDNVADIFTKPLGPQQFAKLCQSLNVLPVSDNE
ncbi:hypothetical protein PR003_g23404 [Phytophthora rubi]|uniref:Reverse transcriptase Ty1/copia-type domain-containing protein n=1 Tax=Phytophthora rubi TaxID=129364 RepID=A0A6A3LEV8_9STRA|nr:hypothetical protein PR001_g14484 [Phytophthora rubi]KAE9297800.1 hypothetical protein PR003_g23404 [Phytophthora rubi]